MEAGIENATLDTFTEDFNAFSVGFLDYVADAPGASTPRQAIARYRLDGDHVVISPHAPRQGGRWLLVDDHNLIRTSLGLQHDEQGWLVDEVKSCGDRKSGAPAVR